MSSKAISLASEIRDDLARRFTLVSGLLFDTDGLPYINVSQGTMAAGQQAAVVKVADIAPLGSNVIGQAAVSYGHPLQIQVVLETSTIANVALMLESNKVALLGAINLRGQRVQLYMSANTNAVDPADIILGNLKVTFDPDQKYKTMLGA